MISTYGYCVVGTHNVTSCSTVVSNSKRFFRTTLAYHGENRRRGETNSDETKIYIIDLQRTTGARRRKTRREKSRVCAATCPCTGTSLCRPSQKRMVPLRRFSRSGARDENPRKYSNWSHFVQSEYVEIACPKKIYAVW